MHKSTNLQRSNEELFIDLKATERPATSNDTFFWKDDIFCHAGKVSLNLQKGLTTLDSFVAASLKRHLLDFAMDGSYSISTSITLVGGLRNALNRYPTTQLDLPWMAKVLDCDAFCSAKGSINKFFRYWKLRDAGAISDDALQLLSNTKLKNRQSVNALSDNPTLGWLTEIEYDLLLQAIWKNYDSGTSCSQVTLMRLLSMQYARRPIQLAHLKIGDFHHSDTNYGSSVIGRQIHFPGVKDLSAETSFRGSKFEIHPIADHLWDLFLLQQQRVKDLYQDCLKIQLCREDLNLLPIFCTATQIRTAVNTLREHHGMDWQKNLESEQFHLHPHTISAILRWGTNRTFYGQKGKAQNVEPPISHRTGAPLEVNATRLRHTRARQLARLGVRKHVLSHWMGHTHEISLDAYYSDPAEDARQLDELMSPVLIPLAIAFAGNLIDEEINATRAGDPASQIELARDGQLTNVGNCGKHTFCAATSIPIPCYRCKHFEPLVNAPHDEVLDALRHRQKEERSVLTVGGARNLLVPIDLSADIRAVHACIELCRVRKSELAKQ